MIRANRALFVLDDETSDEYIQHYRTEVDLMELEIRKDNTMATPYYQLFRWFRDGKRRLNEQLFASSHIEKIIDFVNEYLTQNP